MRKLGELGCDGPEARERLKRYFSMGLRLMYDDPNTPFSKKEKEFLRDMTQALKDNPSFEPSYGQVTYAGDLYERYCL